MLDETLNIYKAIAEETRLRIAALLSRGELTVSEITQILGQSQPRVSRHLKILADAGIVERYREGAWMFYRLSRSIDPGIDGEPGHAAIHASLDALATCSDRIIARDRERFHQSREARAALAAAYFEENAANWDQVRRLHLPDSDIEARMSDVIGQTPVGLFVDLGTGTGRMLEVFSRQYDQGIGYDISREMLTLARDKLDKAGITNAQVRHGDLFTVPLESHSADLVCVHQVLHFLTEPDLAVAEAARLIRPGGRLIISDFAPHDLEFLREAHAHRRLGFSDDEVRDWCRRAGLQLVRTQTLSTARRAGDNSLTVKIWLCSLPHDATASAKAQAARLASKTSTSSV